YTRLHFSPYTTLFRSTRLRRLPGLETGRCLRHLLPAAVLLPAVPPQSSPRRGSAPRRGASGRSVARSASVFRSGRLRSRLSHPRSEEHTSELQSLRHL